MRRMNNVTCIAFYDILWGVCTSFERVSVHTVHHATHANGTIHNAGDEEICYSMIFIMTMTSATGHRPPPWLRAAP